MNTFRSDTLYKPHLDGLRFVAFFLVFVHHHPFFSTIPVFRQVHRCGWFGVDLFFVLSAYLFTTLLLAEHAHTNTISIKKFYVRRIFRIWPAYFAVILLSTMWFFSYENGAVTKTVLLRGLGLCTFTDNIAAAIVHEYNPLPFVMHLWTVGYEEQFYLLIPAVILLLVRCPVRMRGYLLFSAATVLSLLKLLFIVKHVPHPAIWVLPFTHFESLLAGVVIGFGGYDRLLKRIHPAAVFAAGTGLMALVCVGPALSENSVRIYFPYIATALGSSLMVFGALRHAGIASVLSNRLLVFLGKRSYGLYLYHLFGIMMADLILRKTIHDFTGGLLSACCALSITVAAAMLSYKYIETPFLIIKKKYEIIHSRPV